MCKPCEPFTTAVFYIGGPRDGGSAEVVLSEPLPAYWIQIDDPDHVRSLEEFNHDGWEIWEQPWGWEVRVEPYNGFQPGKLRGRSGVYQIGKDGNYHWHPYDKPVW